MSRSTGMRNGVTLARSDGSPAPGSLGTGCGRVVRRSAREMLAAALQQAVALEGDEVVVDGARRGEADGVGDLANRGRIAALLDRARDVVEDPLPALDVMPGHGLRRAAP